MNTIIPLCPGCRKERAGLAVKTFLVDELVLHDGHCDCYVCKPKRPRIGVIHVHPWDESHRPWDYLEVA